MPQRGFQFHEYDSEYSLPGDEVPKNKPVRYERPDTTEYMMRQVRPDEVVNPRVKELHDYYSAGGYQYGKRKRKK